MPEPQRDTPPAAEAGTPEPASGIVSTQGSTPGETLVAGRYRLLRKLGEGGMGAVFLAEHVHMRKRFALKLLLPEAMASPEIVARFEREAVAAANIGHPGVCSATDFGRLDDGSFFLILEYVDGRSLRAVLQEGALSPARAAGIARQVLAALAAAHAKGVVHRDIKPENVMLVVGPTGEDVVKVLDFGIAKIDANSLGEGQGTALTRMGAIYGTPTYMAPEQAMGRAVDHRADLYAVGIMLHEMISGAPPFDGDGVIVLAKHVHEPPPMLRSPHGGVDPELAAVVGALLAKAPEDRPADAIAAIAAIDRVSRGGAQLSIDRLSRGERSLSGSGSFAAESGPFSAAQAATIAGDGAQAFAPTLVGGPAPAPAPSPAHVVIGRILARLSPVAARLGVAARDLAVAVAIVCAALLLGLAILLFRAQSAPGPQTREGAREGARDEAGASSAETAADEPAVEKSPEPAASAKRRGAGSASAAPSASASTKGRGSGGGLRGLGRKIKGLF
jgi:serine/threonine-protein kinase